MQKIALRELIYVAFFAALTTVGAWISFPLPFSPVPVVLANLFAILAGVILGKWLGSLSQIVYLLLGFAGIPVFAQHQAGPHVFAGPTGGYLAGYVIAAFVAGALMEHLPRFSRSPGLESFYLALSLATGALVIYVPGIFWLSRVTGMDVPAAMVSGFYPFLPGDILKVIVGTLLCASLIVQLPHVWKWPAGKVRRQAEAENAKAG